MEPHVIHHPVPGLEREVQVSAAEGGTIMFQAVEGGGPVELSEEEALQVVIHLMRMATSLARPRGRAVEPRVLYPLGDDDDEISMWAERGTPIMVKAVSGEQPVELTVEQAVDVATALLRLVEAVWADDTGRRRPPGT